MVQVAPADLGESHDEWGEEEPVKKPSRLKKTANPKAKKKSCKCFICMVEINSKRVEDAG